MSVKHVSLSEAHLRKIISEEIANHFLVKEGIFDDVKGGLKKLSSFISKQFKSVAKSWAASIKEKLDKMDAVPNTVTQMVKITQAAAKNSGESLKLDQSLTSAKEFGKINVDKALEIVNADMKSGVKQKAAAAQKTKTEAKYVASVFNVLNEKSYITNSEPLNEALTVTTVLGISLAIVGGLPMLMKGLMKLADTMGAHNAKELFEKAYHVTHHFEQDVVNKVSSIMPDHMAWWIYDFLYRKGHKLTDKYYNNEIEMLASTDGKKALLNVKTIVYKSLLVYFAWDGIKGVLHAGASLLGAVEGVATTVKGVELAPAAAEIASSLRTAVASAGSSAVRGVVGAVLQLV